MSDSKQQGDEKAHHIAMVEYVRRLTAAGWIEGSYIGPKKVKVRFTARGQTRLRVLFEIMEKESEAWPRGNAEVACLMLLCEMAANSTLP